MLTGVEVILSENKVCERHYMKGKPLVVIQNEAQGQGNISWFYPHKTQRESSSLQVIFALEAIFNGKDKRKTESAHQRLGVLLGQRTNEIFGIQSDQDCMCKWFFN